MSLNNLRLPPQLMADLYGHVLIDGHVQKHAAPIITPSLGENRKQILVVVHEQQHPFLSEANLGFLATVLSACSLSLPDVAIINHHGLKAGVADLHAQFLPQKILVLGVDASVVALPAADSYSVNKSTGIDYLLAPSLDAIQISTEEKRKLWAGLKQLFCL